MGIKFLCPNGHKLNVKSFLKGKKAICPKCGTRVIVPDDSQDISEEQDSGAELAMASTLDAAAGASSANPAASNGSGSGAPTIPPAPAVVPSHPAPSKVSSAKEAAPATSAGQPSVNPIDEAPTAVWYVRPATGGQFGPASGEIMRGWISEGRVGASSLVWRAGWPEWRAASAVFPALGKLLASPVATATVQAVAARPVAVSAAPQPSLPAQQGTLPSGEVLTPVAQALRKRRRRNDQTLIISGILLVVTLVLVAVLVFVWQNQQSGGAADEPAAAAEATSSLLPLRQPLAPASQV